MVEGNRKENWNVLIILCFCCTIIVLIRKGAAYYGRSCISKATWGHMQKTHESYVRFVLHIHIKKRQENGYVQYPLGQ